MTDSTLSAEQREQIGPILGRIPSGVFILTAGNGAGEETAMLASWVQQASFDPPLLSIAVNAKRYLNDWIAAHPRVAVSCVGKEQSGPFFKQFGKGFEPGDPAFEGFDITRGVTGLPLLSAAVGSLEGTVIDSIVAGDHTIYLVRVENAVRGTAFENDQPFVHIRKNGFHY